MKKLLIIYFFITIIASCQRKSGDSASSKNQGIDTLVDERIVSVGVTAAGSNVLDSIRWYLTNQKPISKSLYKRIFKNDLSDIDKVFVSEIRNSVGFINPVITVFNTVESDRSMQFVDLNLFDATWTLKESKSLKYEVGYDLYSQDYTFLNDSIIEIVAAQGIGFDTDDYVRTIVKVHLNEVKLFDTLGVKIDTIRVGNE